MLKLKDIFNIDISSKGGGKLYKKIMRKYNIPLKEIKEVKQEIEENTTGGSDNGNLEYLYIKLNDTIPTGYMYGLPVGIPIVSKRINYTQTTSIGPGVITPVTYAITMGVLMEPFNVTSINWLGICLLKIKTDDIDTTSLEAIVDKYSRYSAWEEITKEEYNSLQ